MIQDKKKLRDDLNKKINNSHEKAQPVNFKYVPVQRTLFLSSSEEIPNEYGSFLECAINVMKTINNRNEFIRSMHADIIKINYFSSKYKRLIKLLMNGEITEDYFNSKYVVFQRYFYLKRKFVYKVFVFIKSCRNYFNEEEIIRNSGFYFI
jgi:hypothetical protein